MIYKLNLHASNWTIPHLSVILCEGGGWITVQFPSLRANKVPFQESLCICLDTKVDSITHILCQGSPICGSWPTSGPWPILIQATWVTGQCKHTTQLTQVAGTRACNHTCASSGRTCPATHTNEAGCLHACMAAPHRKPSPFFPTFPPPPCSGPPYLVAAANVFCNQ